MIVIKKIALTNDIYWWIRKIENFWLMHVTLFVIGITIDKDEIPEFLKFHEVWWNSLELEGFMRDLKKSKEFEKSLGGSKAFREFVGNLRELFSYVCICVYWMRDSSIHTELVLIIRPYSYERAGWPRLAFQKFFQILVNFRKSGFQHFSILHFRCFLLVKNYWSRSQSQSRGLGHDHGHENFSNSVTVTVTRARDRDHFADL